MNHMNMNTKKSRITSRKANTVCLELVHPSAQNAFVAGSFNNWTPERRR